MCFLEIPYQQYGGARVATLNNDQQSAKNKINQLANTGNSGVNAANDYIQNSIYDNYLDMAGNMAGQNNPYQGQNTQAGTNAMLGMNNPYLQSSINNAQTDVINQYKNTTTPQLAAQQRTAGAFGNTGLQQMQNRALGDLTTNLGRISNDMRMQDYGMQTQLQEADVNRRLSNDQQNIQRNSGLAENQLNRRLNAFQNERGNQLQAMGMTPGLQAAQYYGAGQQFNMGEQERQNWQQQLNTAYDDWTRGQENDLRNLEILSKTISASMGGGQTFTTQPSNMAANMIGLGLGGYGMAQGMGLRNPGGHGMGAGPLGAM